MSVKEKKKIDGDILTSREHFYQGGNKVLIRIEKHEINLSSNCHSFHFDLHINGSVP